MQQLSKERPQMQTQSELPRGLLQARQNDTPSKVAGRLSAIST
jgi:hypothetical protein